VCQCAAHDEYITCFHVPVPWAEGVNFTNQGRAGRYQVRGVRVGWGQLNLHVVYLKGAPW
jgi:hypothetical protein